MVFVKMVKRNDNDSDYVSHNTGEAQVSLQELTQIRRLSEVKQKHSIKA